jgi:hypothetical protein
MARGGEVRVLLSGRDALVRVELPRGLGRARITVGDRVVASVTRGTVTPTEAASADGVAIAVPR